MTTRPNSLRAGSWPSSTTARIAWRRLWPARSDAASVIRTSGSCSSNARIRLRALCARRPPARPRRRRSRAARPRCGSPTIRARCRRSGRRRRGQPGELRGLERQVGTLEQAVDAVPGLAVAELLLGRAGRARRASATARRGGLRCGYPRPARRAAPCARSPRRPSAARAACGPRAARAGPISSANSSCAQHAAQGEVRQERAAGGSRRAPCSAGMRIALGRRPAAGHGRAASRMRSPGRAAVTYWIRQVRLQLARDLRVHRGELRRSRRRCGTSRRSRTRAGGAGRARTGRSRCRWGTPSPSPRGRPPPPAPAWPCSPHRARRSTR